MCKWWHTFNRVCEGPLGTIMICVLAGLLVIVMAGLGPVRH
jgi:hypothetical protein